MEFEKFEFITRAAVKCDQDQKKYLEQVPSDISSAVFGNGYVAPLEFALLEVLNIALGEELHQELMWYMFDRPQGGGEVRMDDGRNFWIDSIESFLSYIKEVYFK